MIKISALFFIILVNVNMFSALELSPMDAALLPSQSSRSQLMEIMVEAQTQKDPNTIKGFVQELRGMLDRLVDAFNQHKAIHAQMMKQCIEETKYRKNQEAQASRALTQAGAARTRAQASLKANQKALPQLQNTKKTYVKELGRATAARKDENRRYVLRKADYTDAIAFLRRFNSYVATKFKGQFKAYSMIEMSEELVRHAAKLDAMTAVVPVLVAISSNKDFYQGKANTYSYTGNEALATQLRNLLNNLLNTLVSDDHKNDEEEARAVRVFNVYRGKLNAVIATLTKNIQRTKKQINDMTRSIDTENAVMLSASNKLARNHRLRKNANKMCRAFNAEFIEATKNREDEIKTMHAILKIVHRRFKKLPHDLISYLEDVKNGWKVYVNSTEFKKFKEYQRVTFASNQRGQYLTTQKGQSEK
jgi:hypothetical protein